MTDSEIILNYLTYCFPDDHPAVYQYIEGGVRSQTSAIERMLRECDIVLMPPYSAGHVRTVIRKFLKGKKKLHQEGKLKIKPIY